MFELQSSEFFENVLGVLPRVQSAIICYNSDAIVLKIIGWTNGKLLTASLFNGWVILQNFVKHHYFYKWKK
jgi:hypothetical protein